MCGTRQGCVAEAHATNKCQEAVSCRGGTLVGGSLVVAPTTILQQWLQETKRHVSWAQEDGRVLVYHGTHRAADLSSLSSAHIVITSYGVVAAEYAAARRARGVRGAGEVAPSEGMESGGRATEEDGLRSRAAVGLFDVAWYRVILDEAHLVKSHSSLSSRAVAALRAPRRWALTGSPLHNTCDDLLALFKFLRADPWADTGWWHRAISRRFTERPGDLAVMSLVRGILKPLMLRRILAHTAPAAEGQGSGGAGEAGEGALRGRGDELGKSVRLELPPKIVEVEVVEFSEEERALYDAIFKRSKSKFDELMTGGALLSNYACVLEMLLRLRQACVHAFLLTSRADTGSGSDQDFARLTSHLLSRHEDKTSDASTSLRSPSTGDAALPDATGSAGGETYVAGVVARAQTGVLDDCAVCLEPVFDPVVTPCAHVFCRACILQLATHGNQGAGATTFPSPRKRARSAAALRCPTCRTPFVAGDVRAVPRKSRFLEDVRANWRPSAKISALVRDLSALHLAHPQNPRRQDAARGVEEDRMEEEEEVRSVEQQREKGKQRRQQGQGGGEEGREREGEGTGREENEGEEETLRVDMGKSVVFSQA